MTLAPPVPRIPDRHRRDGSSSIASSMRPPHVDLLDAQSEFKPADFRSRVQAAGARDYGEDVAERNLGVNGVDLTSPAVKAFYTLTGGAALAYRSDGSAVDVHGNMYQAERIPQDLKDASLEPTVDEGLARNSRRIRHPDQRRRSELFDVAAKQNHGRQPATPDRRTGAEERELKAAHRRVSVSNRRNSLQELLTAAPIARPKHRPLSSHPLVSVQTADPAPPPGIPRYRPKTSDGREYSPVLQASPVERIRGVSSKKKRRGGDVDPYQAQPPSFRSRRSSLPKKAHRASPAPDIPAYKHAGSSDEGDIDSAPPPGQSTAIGQRITS